MEKSVFQILLKAKENVYILSTVRRRQHTFGQYHLLYLLQDELIFFYFNYCYFFFQVRFKLEL